MTEESHNPFMEGDEVPSEEAAQAAKLLAAEAAESRAKLAKERAEAALARSEATRDLEPKADASDPKAPIDSSSDIPAAPSKPVLRTVPPTPAPVAPASKLPSLQTPKRLQLRQRTLIKSSRLIRWLQKTPLWLACQRSLSMPSQQHWPSLSQSLLFRTLSLSYSKLN